MSADLAVLALVLTVLAVGLTFAGVDLVAHYFAPGARRIARPRGGEAFRGIEFIVWGGGSNFFVIVWRACL